MEDRNIERAFHIVHHLMFENDEYSKWLGIQIEDISPGYCKIKCAIHQKMLNGFGILHGGITFSIADSALAFASNAHNIKAFSIETSISHLKKVDKDDILIAVCEEKHLTSKFGHYEVNIVNKSNQLVALFKGIVYRTGKKWIEE